MPPKKEKQVKQPKTKIKLKATLPQVRANF